MKIRVHRHAVVQPQDQSIKLIPLSQQQNAIVDAEDFEFLSQWNWTASWKPKTKSFYAYRKNHPTKRGENIQMHRVVVNAPADRQVDHINGNGLDNRKCNLRLATNSQNGANAGPAKNNTSGFIGVSRRSDCNRWEAEVWLNGKKQWRGLFRTAIKAARARDKAAARIHGAFARLNFPKPHGFKPPDLS